MDLTHVALISVSIFLGGVVSGFAGFAFAAPAGALLAFAFPPSATVPLLLVCGLLNQSLSIWALRAKMRWQSALPYLLGGAVGLQIGIYILSSIGPAVFRHGFGLFLILYALLIALKPVSSENPLMRYPAVSATVGAVGGFIGGFTAMPGAVPAVWLDLCGKGKEDKRGTLQPFIFGMQLFSLPVMLFAHGLNIDPWMIAISIPALVAGTRLGVFLFGRMSERIFRYGTLALLGVSGCLLAI